MNVPCANGGLVGPDTGVLVCRGFDDAKDVLVASGVAGVWGVIDELDPNFGHCRFDPEKSSTFKMHTQR